MTNIDKHMTYFNMLEVMREQSCPICNLINKSVSTLMETLLYEQVNDPLLRKEIREAHGFCSGCAWQLAGIGDAFGLSIIYKDILQELSKFVKSSEHHTHTSLINGIRNIFSHITPHINQEDKYQCPICKKKREAEQRYMEIFLKNLHDEEFFDAYKDSFGLCIPHIRAAINISKEDNLTAKIIRTESRKLHILIEELKEFQRKHDYRFSDEEYEKESDAWIRAIEKTSGKKGVF